MFEWPNGSTCHVPRGFAAAPKFLTRNWWPRVVWSTIAVHSGDASSCMHHAPLMNSSCFPFTCAFAIARFASDACSHQRAKKPVST